MNTHCFHWPSCFDKLLPRNNSGMALLVTLAVILVLTTSVLYLAKITGRSVLATTKEVDLAQGHEIALSGIHLAMAILALDASVNEIDSVQEDWADPDKVAKMVSSLGLTKAKLTLKITDELGKLQVNAILKRFPGHEINQNQFRIWENFLDLRFSSKNRSAKGLDEMGKAQEISGILDAMVDWMDSRDDNANTGLFGAESDYYQQLDTPYFSKNGPFSQVSELILVKGITRDMVFHGDQDEELFQESTTTPSFKDLVTVHGLADDRQASETYHFTGKVNINTASAEVLSAILPKELAFFGQQLAEYREEAAQDGRTYINALDKGWYEKVIELTEKGKKDFNGIIRYDSDLFWVQAGAKINRVSKGNGSRVHLSAIIKRERNTLTGKWECRMLQLMGEDK